MQIAPRATSQSNQNAKVADDRQRASEEAWKRMQAQYGEKPKTPKDVKTRLDQEDFMRIMLEQMKNQDPTEPFKADKLASEIAQIASIEQLGNVKKAIDNLNKKDKPLEKLAMTNLIGKTVAIDGSRFRIDKGDQKVIAYDLPKAAAEVKLALISDRGETVFEANLGEQQMGRNSYLWNGVKDNTLPAEAGGYSYRITAVDGSGQSIEVQPENKAKIIGVSFSGVEPTFLVGDRFNHERVPLSSIGEIIDADDNAKEQNLGAPKFETKAPVATSNAVDVGKATPPPSMSPATNPILPTVSPKQIAKGFPSGLTDPEQQGGKIDERK